MKPMYHGLLGWYEDVPPNHTPFALDDEDPRLILLLFFENSVLCALCVRRRRWPHSYFQTHLSSQ